MGGWPEQELAESLDKKPSFKFRSKVFSGDQLSELAAKIYADIYCCARYAKSKKLCNLLPPSKAGDKESQQKIDMKKDKNKVTFMLQVCDFVNVLIQRESKINIKNQYSWLLNSGKISIQYI